MYNNLLGCFNNQSYIKINTMFQHGNKKGGQNNETNTFNFNSCSYIP